MRLVINMPDGVVGIDNVFINMDLSSLPSYVRVVQWDNNIGHIEKFDSSVIELKSILYFKNIIENAEAIIAKNKQINEEKIRENESYFNGVEVVEKNNVVFSYRYIDDLVKSVKFTDLTLAVRVRSSDEKAIGIDVLNAVKSSEQGGLKTLLSIRQLFKFCRDNKVPFMTDVQPSNIEINRYCDFLKSQGATIYKFESKERYYVQFLV